MGQYSGPGYSGPNYLPPRSRSRRVAPPGGSNATLLGCGTFVLGFLVAVALGAIAVFFLYFYNPNPTQPLNRPDEQNGVPDLSATISQTYLNREIARQLSGKPFQAGPVLIRDVVVEILSDSRLDIAMRASSGPATFDIKITERLVVENGQVGLEVVGQPRLTGGQLPPGINNILNTVNEQFIAPQLNRQVSQITISNRPLRLTGLASSPGLLTVRANVQ